MQLSAISLFSRRHVTDCIQSRAKGFPFETRPGILRMRKTGRRTGCAFVIPRAHVITTPRSGLAAPTPGQHLSFPQ